jgi:hypothetical protein
MLDSAHCILLSVNSYVTFNSTLEQDITKLNKYFFCYIK